MAILTYDLAVIGRANVEREIASLERRYAQHARTMNRIGASAGGGVSGSRSGTAGQQSADRAARRAIVEQQRAIDQRLKSQAALHRQRSREEKQYATEQARTHAAAQRAIDRQVRSQTALSRQRTREQRIAHREREQAINARSEFARSTVGGGLGRVVSGVTAVGRAGASMLGVGGAALAASSVNQAMKLDETARRLSIASRAPGEAGVSPEILRKEFTQTGIATGFAPEIIGAATAAYVTKTGDLGTARANQRTLATVAQGSDADAVDVFRAAADLSSKLGIKSAEDMQAAFAILSQQGKKGAFELKAMASEFPEVLGMASTAGVRGVSGVRDVGAIMQIARDTSGSDSEAATAVNSMFRALTSRSKDIQSGKAFGGRKVQVFEDGDATKPMNNFVDVLANSIEASRGNLVQLQDVFDVRGKKAIDPLISSYQQASNATLQRGGSKKEAHEAGRAAIESKFSGYRDVKADWSEVQRDATDAMKSTSVQFAVALTMLKDAMGTQLLPEITKLIPKLAELAPLVGDLTAKFIAALSWLTDNPWTGLGAAVSAAIVLELAKAGIGMAVSSALTAIITRTMGGAAASSVATAAASGGATGLGARLLAGGGLALGAAGAAAAAGVGATYLAADNFQQQNGGWGSVAAFMGMGEVNGWGADAVMALQDKQAKDKAALEWRAPQPTGMVDTSRLPTSWDVRQTPAPKVEGVDEASASFKQLAQVTAVLAGEFGKVQGLNRGDKPTGIKN